MVSVGPEQGGIGHTGGGEAGRAQPAAVAVPHGGRRARVVAAVGQAVVEPEATARAG